MKKTLALLVTLVICVAALTGCSSDAPEKPTPPETSLPVEESTAPETQPQEPATQEPQLSEYDQWKNSILEHVDEAYTGMTDARASMHYLWGDEGKFAVLVLVNADGQSYISFAGDAIVDDYGVLTVTDRETGYYFGFSVEEQAGNKYLIDCGNLGVAYLEADEPGDVLDVIARAYATMEDVTVKLVDTLERVAFLESLDVAYIGMTEAEVPMFFLASSDGEFAALVLVGKSGETYISFVGSALVDDETGIITIIDSETDYTFRFTAEAMDDGSFLLDCGNMGAAVLLPRDIEEVVDIIDAIYLELRDVTADVAGDEG